MKFSPPLIKATLLKRYKRFLADVSHPELGEFTVHCPNTGSMKNCWNAGWSVWLQKSENLKRKYPYTWVLVENDFEEMIGINTQLANKLVVEGIEQKKIAELSQIKDVQTEVKYGAENSRIDILITHTDDTNTYVEVKSVTLRDSNPKTNLGFFPDAKTTRGQKHIRELMQCVKQGDKAMLFFMVQHSGIQSVEIETDIDPVYDRLIKEAIKVGVTIVAYKCDINSKEITLEQSIPFIL